MVSKEITQNKEEKVKKVENIEDQWKDTSHCTFINQKTGEGVWKFMLSLQLILMHTRVCKPLVKLKKNKRTHFDYKKWLICYWKKLS